VVAVADLVSLIGRLDPNEYRRGKQFEQIVEWFLTHAPEYATQVRWVWLWDDWPDRPSRDLGIDLVAEARNGDLWAIQAKAYAWKLLEPCIPLAGGWPAARGIYALQPVGNGTST
jgi:predicted helicase